MNLNRNLHVLCKTAIEAAQRAGSIINQYRGRDFRVDHKTVGNSEASQVVTEVDYKAQQAIVEILTPTLAQYDLALLAEETPDDGLRFEKQAFWSIDPMDGTLAFVKNVTGFSVSIALVSREGKPLIGVVYDPENHDSYHAINGSGAFKNNEPIKPTALNRSNPLVLCTDSSFKTHHYLTQTQDGMNSIASIIGLTEAKIEFRIGAVMNAITALTQPNYCYFKFSRNDNSGGSIWDYAATACLYNESNSVASDIYGNPLDLNRPDSCFMNHRGLIYSPCEELADAIVEFNRRLELR
jgi:fructose-1,6-bisphosphatase/inositol monophosphatase family enzyme